MTHFVAVKGKIPLKNTFCIHTSSRDPFDNPMMFFAAKFRFICFAKQKNTAAEKEKNRLAKVIVFSNLLDCLNLLLYIFYIKPTLQVI